MLEVVTIAGRAPTLVFLHEGLGCVAMWRDVPALLAARTGCAALVYSRAGYGRSHAVSLPRPLDYMEGDGVAELSGVLAGIDDAVLIGHSDGGTIALAYAASHGGLRGVIVEAAHVFCEDASIRSIEAARAAFVQGDLRRRLAAYHGDNVDCAFWGWNDAWLHPDFRRWNIEASLPRIAVPVLALQGRQDAYGTPAQLEAIARGVARAEVRLLDDCGHTPHREQPQITLDAMVAFVAGLPRPPTV